MPSRLAPLYLVQRLLAFLIVLDVNLDKYGVTGSSVKLNSRNKTLTKLLKTYWAEQISCPSSPVPYLLAPQHTPKTCFLDEGESRILDQNSKQITIILRSFRWSAGTDCHLSQQTSGLTLIDLSDLQSDDT